MKNIITQVEANNGGSGVIKEYHENGKLEWEIPYINGKIDGIKKWYYENGTIRNETPFINDKRNGVQKWYFENGTLQWERPLKDGLLDGVSKWYYGDGTLASETLYKDGVEVPSKDKIKDYGVAIITEISDIAVITSATNPVLQDAANEIKKYLSEHNILSNIKDKEDNEIEIYTDNSNISIIITQCQLLNSDMYNEEELEEGGLVGLENETTTTYEALIFTGFNYKGQTNNYDNIDTVIAEIKGHVGIYIDSNKINEDNKTNKIRKMR